MNKFIFLIPIFFCTSNILSQGDSDSGITGESKTLSRLKLSGGYFIGRNSEAGEDSPFLNFNYYAAELNKSNDQFDFGFAAEAGVYMGSGFFPFYLKAGPEIVIIKNLIAGINIGYLGIFVYPVPFYGLNSFYLLELSDSIYLEFESGFHSTFTEKKYSGILFQCRFFSKLKI
jgi:hypothetical protein